MEDTYEDQKVFSFSWFLTDGSVEMWIHDLHSWMSSSIVKLACFVFFVVSGSLGESTNGVVMFDSNEGEKGVSWIEIGKYEFRSSLGPEM